VNAPAVVGTPRCLWPAQAALGEGTVWSVREQALWWVDILAGRLHRWNWSDGAQRSWSVGAPGETISALAERASAPGLLVTLRRGFAFFDPATGALQRLAEPEPERAGNRFNDGKCDAQGRFWGGSMDAECVAPTGALYRYDADGRCTRVFEAGYPVTNGPTWSRDGRTMFFNDTARRNVYAFDADAAAGTLAAPRLFLRFAKDDGYPDGMTIDADGRLWIAHWGGSCVTCHDPDNGNELARVVLPASQITNVAFGGPDLSTLFISSARTGLDGTRLAAEPLAGALFAVDTEVRGQPAHLFAG